MMSRKLVSLVALLGGTSALFGCIAGQGAELVGTARQGQGGTGSNDVSPQALGAVSATLGVLDPYGITSSMASPPVVDPLHLCDQDPGSGSSCLVGQAWNNWLNDSVNHGRDMVSHQWMMTGFAKCALESGFTVYDKAGNAYPGEWGLQSGWKTNRLAGQADHERVSGCIIAMLNGNDEHITIAMFSPGAPFNAPCDDPSFTQREAGFFGDLFGAKQTAYVAGPQEDQLVDNGRVCSATQGTYCCLESDSDTTCNHGSKIVLVPGILQRCNDNPMPYAGNSPDQFCTSFFSTKEPGRVYHYGWTTYLPAQ